VEKAARLAFGLESRLELPLESGVELALEFTLELRLELRGDSPYPTGQRQLRRRLRAATKIGGRRAWRKVRRQRSDVRGQRSDG
jgi:hypothetical protein